MVRFIMKNHNSYAGTETMFYIPIWLDLLLIRLSATPKPILIFTFQYG